MTLPNSVQTGDPGHVEHHNAIKALLDERITAATASGTYVALTGDQSVAGKKTFTGPLQHDGGLIGLLGGSPSVRIPFSVNPTVDGPAAKAAGTENVSPAVLAPKLTGDFTGITGADAGQAFCLNLFAIADATLRGMTTVNAALLELAVSQDAGTIDVARGAQIEVSLFGASAGATITQAESLRVAAPNKKSGAVGGSIVNAYGLFIENVTEGTTSNFSLFVDGGVSRFRGRVDVGNDIVSVSDTVKLAGGFSGHAFFEATGPTFGGNATIKLGAASSSLIFKNDADGEIATLDKFSLNLREGININTGTTTGSKIAGSSLQLLSFWGAVPVVQQPKPADLAGVISLLAKIGLCAP